MSARKFYKTVVTVTILSERGPVSPSCELDHIHRELQDGYWIGEVDNDGGTELTGAEVAKALVEMGSTPDFFDLEDDGTDLLE